MDRAAHLVEQLVTMARLEPESPARDNEPVDLAALAREAIVARAALAGDKQIDLGLTRTRRRRRCAATRRASRC